MYVFNIDNNGSHVDSFKKKNFRKYTCATIMKLINMI